MGLVEYVVTTPSSVKEFRDAVFRAGNDYTPMTVTARCRLNELALRRIGLQRVAPVRDFTFRIEDIQPNPKDFLVIAQEIEENGDGRTLQIGVDSDQVIISMVVGEPRA